MHRAADRRTVLKGERMDDIENKSEKERALPSSNVLEYLFKQLLELETRIEQLEEKNEAVSKEENALLSKADSIEEKLDLLIKQIQCIPTANGIEDIGGERTCVQKETMPKSKSEAKQKRVAVFIDGENISNKKAEKIIKKSNNQGDIEFARVYGIQNTPSDKCWVKTSQELDIKHIRLGGGSKKNKVDKHMFSEILNEAKKKEHVDTIIIATNDADFITIIKEVRAMGIRVVIMGLKSSLSDKMKKACNSFVYL